MVHIASMANTRMSLPHSRHLQCYLKIRYIHGALRSGYATMRDATIQKTTFFEIAVSVCHMYVCVSMYLLHGRLISRAVTGQFRVRK